MCILILMYMYVFTYLSLQEKSDLATLKILHLATQKASAKKFTDGKKASAKASRISASPKYRYRKSLRR